MAASPRLMHSQNYFEAHSLSTVKNLSFMMILVTEYIQPAVKFMLCRAEDMSELATVEGSAPDRTNLGRTLKIVGTMVTEALEKASLDSNTKVDTYQNGMVLSCFNSVINEMTQFTAEDNHGHLSSLFSNFSA